MALGVVVVTDQNSTQLVWNIAGGALFMFLLFLITFAVVNDWHKALWYAWCIFVGAVLFVMCLFFGAAFFLGAAPYAP